MLPSGHRGRPRVGAGMLLKRNYRFAAIMTCFVNISVALTSVMVGHAAEIAMILLLLHPNFLEEDLA